MRPAECHALNPCGGWQETLGAMGAPQPAHDGYFMHAEACELMQLNPADL